MTDAMQSLETQYIFLTTNLAQLLAACQTPADNDALMTQYVTCRRNYWSCVDEIFHDDDPAVQALVAQMGQEQANLTAAVTHIGAIAGVITTITNAVTTGAALAAKVA